MRRTRIPFALATLFVGAALLSRAAYADAPQITLPEVMAIELPRGVSEIGPNDTPLREFLAQARCGALAVTSEMPRKVGPGPVRVTWKAWRGSPWIGTPLTTRVDKIIVLPAGMTPVGVSGDE